MKPLILAFFASGGLLAQLQPGGTGICTVSGSQTSGYVLTATNNAKACSWQSVGGASVDAGTLRNAWYIADGSVSANSITGTTATTFPGSYAAGQAVIVKVANTNTGATTINVNSLGAKGVTKSGSTALAAGNLVGGRDYLLVYDGTQFQVIGFTILAADIPALTAGSAPQKANGSGGLTAAAEADIEGLWASGSCSGYLHSGGTCSTPSAGSGNGANPVSVSFSATPTFTCGSSTGGTIDIFTVGALTGNITSSTLSGCTTGQLLVFLFTQDSTGGRTVAMPTGFDPLTISPTAGKSTSLLYQWDGTSGHYVPGTNDTQSVLFMAERAAAATPASAAAVCWPDSTDHSGLECKANNSSSVYKLLLSGVDINPVTGQVTNLSHVTNNSLANSGLANASMTIAGHSVSLGGTQSIACADLTNGAASCSTDTTNGSNISSGTVAAARLGTMTGDSGSGGAKGAAPAPASGDAAAGKFLKADATWAVPSGGGNLSSGNTNGAGAQKFFGTAAPGSVTGNLSGDLFSDTTNHNEYWCNAASGASAPACTSVATGAWTLLNGGGSTPSGATGQSLVYPSGSTASAVTVNTQLANVYLPNATFPKLTINNASAASADYDFKDSSNATYTVPANRRLACQSVGAWAASSSTLYPEVKISGSYYGISSSASVSTASSFVAPFILEAGNGLAMNDSNATTFNASAECIEFDNTVPLKTATSLAPTTGGDRVVYTCPANTCSILSSSLSINGPAIGNNFALANNTFVWKAAGLEFGNLAAPGSSAIRQAPPIVINLASGDTVTCNPSASTALQICWVSVLEH